MQPFVLAAVSALAISPLASAQVFGGVNYSTVSPFTITTASQTSGGAELSTLSCWVQRSNGVIEQPVFTQVSASAAEAVGSDFIVRLNRTGNTTTNVEVRATTASCDIYAVLLGHQQGRAGFDVKPATNPSTGASGAGFVAATPSIMIGAYTAIVGFEQPLRIGAAAPVLDMYKAMAIRFLGGFNSGDRFVFVVDTDRIG
jgi:hypothetical protein